MPRPGLSADAVIGAAMEIADSAGIESLTLSLLAKRLGVRPPSLYKHVAGLEDILQALSLRGLQEVNRRLQRATVGKSRDAALFALASAYWQFARDRPGLYAASLRIAKAREREIGAANDMLLATVLAVLSGYGISGNDMIHASRGLRTIIHGFVSLDASGAFRLKSDLDETFTRLLEAYARDLAARGQSSPDGA